MAEGGSRSHKTVHGKCAGKGMRAVRVGPDRPQPAENRRPVLLGPVSEP